MLGWIHTLSGGSWEEGVGWLSMGLSSHSEGVKTSERVLTLSHGADTHRHDARTKSSLFTSCD